MKTKRSTFFLCKTILIFILSLYPFLLLFFHKGYFLLAIIGVIIVIISDLLANRQKLWFDARPGFVYAFFVLPILSVIWSHYPHETLIRGSFVLVNLLIFYLMLRGCSFDNFDLISIIVIIVPAVMMLTFILIYINFGSVRVNSKEMLDTVGSISNAGSAITVLCVPYLLILQRSSLFEKRYYWFSLGACFVVVLMSQSRGGLFTFLLAVLFSISFRSENWSTHIVRIFKFCLLALPILIILVLSGRADKLILPVIERFENSQLINSATLINPQQNIGTDFSRSVMYSEGFNIIRERPVLGIGYGGLYQYIENRYGFGVVSHNIFITAWGEMGILGMAVLMGLIWSVFYGLWKLLRKDFSENEGQLVAAATLIALVVAFIHAQFRPVYSNPMIPLLLAQAYSLIGKTKKRIYLVSWK